MYLPYLHKSNIEYLITALNNTTIYSLSKVIKFDMILLLHIE